MGKMKKKLEFHFCILESREETIFNKYTTTHHHHHHQQKTITNELKKERKKERNNKDKEKERNNKDKERKNKKKGRKKETLSTTLLFFSSNLSFVLIFTRCKEVVVGVLNRPNERTTCIIICFFTLR
jgi:hypothetical protein